MIYKGLGQVYLFKVVYNFQFVYKNNINGLHVYKNVAVLSCFCIYDVL
jgi:hypothetical protein